MATGVNVKMGVSGVQQFKQGMKESQAAVKTLDQALKLNEQQLKSTGDAELYLQNKTKILEDQIAKQTEVVKQSQAALDAMRRNGVQETSTAFQQMQANVYKASADLMRMRSELDGVGDSGADAATEADTLTESLQNMGKGISWQNVTSGIDSITGALEKAAKKALEVGKAITREVLGAGSWADDLHTRATYYGLSDEELQRMEKTADLVDTNVDTIVSAQKKLRKGIGSADTGVMGAYAALLGEGYDPTKEGWENAFWDAGEALMSFTNAEEKEVYAQKLFGRSWNELIPLFETGREQYEELNNSWSVVSDDNLKKLQEMDDQYQKLSNEFETLKMTFLSTLAESLTPLMETLTGLMEKFSEYLQSPEGQAAMEKLGDAISGMFEDLTNADPEKIVENLSGIFDKIQGGLQWLIDNKDTVVNALKIIVGGFALLKLGNIALNVGKIVSGFKDLGWIGGGGGPTVPTATATPAGGAAVGGSMLTGIAGLGAIAAGFAWAQDRRVNHADQVRGTDEYLAAQSSGAEAELVNYLHAMQAQSNLTWTESEAEVAAVVAAVEESRNRLLGTEGGQAALDAYSDWRQENSYGNDYWEVPEYLEKMNTVAGETTDAVTQSTAASAQMTEALKGFETMPALLQAAVEKAVISGMNGVTIVINEGAVDLIGQRTMGGGGQKVLAMIQ